MLILFAEDETDLAELTIDFLETEHIECDYAFDGANALNLLEKNHYDVVVLDVSMPKINGFAVCEKMKQLNVFTPVIFLTARDTLADKLTGFELGAEDYLTKPFELAELAARIKVLAKRKTHDMPTFILNTLQVNLAQRIATRNDAILSLSESQWTLLTLLIKFSPNVVSKTMIEDEVWPEQQPTKDMFKTLVFRLRSIIDQKGTEPLIHTIRGSGIALADYSGYN